MADTRKISIDTGLLSFEVNDLEGNSLGVISLNPTNSAMLPKLVEMIEWLKSPDFNMRDTDDSVSEIARLNSELCERLDNAVCSPVSKVFFATIAPLSRTSDGGYYCNRVLDVLAELINEYSAANDVRVAQVESATAKYTKQDA